ncbi:MAG TPA: ABC transporter ATP-binding protein [Vicinamibacterales bacterium]|nr:ABC transporter ATP-binding protein [Vicinamibacterales bacterium]
MADLRAQHLSKHFSGIRVVSDVNLTLRPGEIVGYLGPNGSGKTTTARMLAGLLEPSSGTVYYGGADIRSDVIGFHRQVGYVPEEPFLYPFLSGREYLELVGRLRDMPEPLLATKIDSFLNLFNLSVAADQSIASYSKGMRQKIVISAALLHDPAVVIFDEPETGLDVATTLMLRHLVRMLAARGKAILYSSHILEVVERVCDRVIVLHKGVVVADDSIARLRELSSSTSLEGVFSQLVIREDPEAVARQLADVASMRS